MRSEAEVVAMIDALQRTNDKLSDALDKMEKEPDEFDALAEPYNSNAKLISALEWVLGADTLRVSEVAE